jgi:hypothetical protein
MAKVKRIEIKTAYNFNDVCDDLLTDWLDDFTSRKGLTREPNEEDFNDFGGEDIVSFMYTKKGMQLYEKACSKLLKLGLKYFNESDLDIKSSGVLHP